MTTNAGRVVVIGDVMTDIIVVPEGPLVQGSDRRAAIRSRPGGSGANQAVWLGAFDVPVTFVARVGAGDKFKLDTYFKDFHVDPQLVADRERPSGVLVTIVDPDGERSFLTDRGANLALSVDDVPVTLLEGTALVLISGYSLFSGKSREACVALIAAARAAGIDVAIDPASAGFLREVGSDNFLRWTRGCTLIFANADEAQALTDSEDLETQMQVLGEHYPTVIIKRGADGAALGGRDGIRRMLPALTADVVDTTGAGDAFAAGFIAARLAGDGEAGCLTAGIAAGARAVQRIGGQPGG